MVRQEFTINNFQPLPPEFYLRDDVVTIAQELLGKVLVTTFNDLVTAGRIVETEAYAGERDKASHAYRGRTGRTAVMYAAGGRAYVYLCYGLHQMFNVVTGPEGVPHAVLIRALEPLQGIETMLQRGGKLKLDYTLTKGPGNVGKAMGFHTSQSGTSLQSGNMFIADDGAVVHEKDMGISPRIGVAYAGADAALPYRFFVNGHPYVSKGKMVLC